jgi:alpha-tubulin suppressor-like RCC1 family protein
MTHIVGTLIRRLAPMLAPALVVAVLGCGDEATSPDAPEPGPALDITPAQVLSFRQVNAGAGHTCGVTTDNLAYCWGLNNYGQLGIGEAPIQLRPVAVAGGLRFRQVSPGDLHTCGVTTVNRAYCWGRNASGQLGENTTMQPSRTPIAVAGALLFRQVSAGEAHTCGVTTDNVAYCWGANFFGHLGDGTGNDSSTPVAVAGGLRFRQVSAGAHHTCGVALNDLTYCWGGNFSGQLGDGTTTNRFTPVRVHAAGLRFGQVSAGDAHTCGVTTDNRAYCWGSNGDGGLGDGTTTTRLTPVPVAGGRRFLRVSAGGQYTCAVNPFDRAFCWGRNTRSQLGDNTTTQRLTPVRVLGGLRFRQVNASEDGGFGGFSGVADHTCGVTTGNLAYCWGDNRFGQLGDGTQRTRRRPTAVAGPS